MTKNTCELTGANVYLDEYREWFRGDVHRVGGVVILRLNPLSRSREAPARVHRRVTKIAGAWPSSPSGAAGDWTVAVEDRHCIDYGREGRVPLKLIGDD